MLYSTLIADIRRAVRDFKFKAEDLFDGDAATLIFIGSHHPIIEDSAQVLVGGSLKTETTHYTLDDDLGELVFTSAEVPASGSDNVKMTYRYANFNDTDYINMINDGIEYFGEKFYTEILDNTTLDTVANQYEYALSGITNGTLIFRVVDVQYRSSSSSNFISLNTVTNVRFLPDLVKIRLNPPLATTGYDMQIRALRTPVIYTTAASTLDIDDNQTKAVKMYAISKYYESLAALKAGDISAISKDQTVSPAQILAAMADKAMRQAEVIAGRVRKPMPAQQIPIIRDGFTN